MVDIKPLKLYGDIYAVNAFKVMIALKVLGLPYEVIEIPYSETKSPAYVEVNPNGRLPSLVDPNNNNFTIWESGAVIEYLVDRYDKNGAISFEHGSNNYYLAKQWLHFQMSGQGPYYGQAVSFSYIHSEYLPSAINRYKNEVLRVSGVLDKWLETHEWLVGEKMSFADLAFVPWQQFAEKLFEGEKDFTQEFPRLQGWLQRMRTLTPVVELFRVKPPILQIPSVKEKMASQREC